MHLGPVSHQPELDEPCFPACAQPLQHPPDVHVRASLHDRSMPPQEMPVAERSHTAAASCEAASVAAAPVTASHFHLLCPSEDTPSAAAACEHHLSPSIPAGGSLESVVSRAELRLPQQDCFERTGTMLRDFHGSQGSHILAAAMAACSCAGAPRDAPDELSRSLASQMTDLAAHAAAPPGYGQRPGGLPAAAAIIGRMPDGLATAPSPQRAQRAAHAVGTAEGCPVETDGNAAGGAAVPPSTAMLGPVYRHDRAGQPEGSREPPRGAAHQMDRPVGALGGSGTFGDVEDEHTRALAADCQRLATEIEDMRCMRKRACQESLRTRVQLAVSDVNGASRAFQLTQMSCTSPTGISSSEQQASLQLADRALRLAVLAGGFDVGPSIIEQAKRLIDQSGGGDASQPDEPRFKRARTDARFCWTSPNTQ
ncbi:hypothetical protein WJX84_008947 [Apatococcus fuscideae]|uniref:Uncharacterized protein n=1 Tax=Apatococcus fuscideae TaxID=2026836 RepID=A0AAW1SPQ8_9CHLO